MPFDPPGYGWDALLTLQTRVARALGVHHPAAAEEAGERTGFFGARDLMTVAASYGNGSSVGCLENCTSPCPNNTTPCLCPCDRGLGPDPSLGAAFASVSFLFFLIATVQLILCMVHDALHRPDHSSQRQRGTAVPEEKWRKAFRLTVQKSLLGAVIGATGTRAIYYTVRDHIEEKWADILLHVYYPALLSAFSLLILFWAEIFYQSATPSENHVFLKKHKYSLTFFYFNALVYLLLLAEVVATPLVHDDTEQVRKSGIIGIIFAVLLFVMLVGFLHLAIRLFFRPDWQPLVLQLEALKINLKQHTLSCLGIVTNALMQALIIALLVFNMLSHFQPMDNYRMYVAILVIRVTELVMPVWFCCSLWNYKKPASLWILNPGLLIQQLDLGGSEREHLVRNRDVSRYGSIKVSVQSGDGYCWVCHDRSPTTDLIQPCRCFLHTQCIQRWVVHRASNPSISRKEVLRCQVCGEKYYTKKRRFLCLPQGLSRKHWIQGGALLLFLALTGLASFYVLVYSHLSSSVKVAIVSVVVLADAALLKFLGCGLIWLGRRRRALVGEITNRPDSVPFIHQQADDVITPATPPTIRGGSPVDDIIIQATPPIATGDSPINTTPSVSPPSSATVDSTTVDGATVDGTTVDHTTVDGATEDLSLSIHINIDMQTVAHTVHS